AVYVTDRRIVGNNFLLAPSFARIEAVAGATRIIKQYTRYGAVVREELTHRVAVVLKSGGGMRVGPVVDPDELVGFLRGVAMGNVVPRTLPGVDGEPPPAERRTDFFFATAVHAGDVPR